MLSGGWTAQLPRVLAPGRLERASAWDAMTFGAASLLGPALAGVVASLWGAVALVALAVPAAWRLPARGPRPAGTPAEAGPLAGAGAVWGNRALARACWWCAHPWRDCG
ncbi:MULTISPECIES: hypothetical protein [unclassified Nocardiopsis]|uniref:hypothetical protein n=1 Tax=unclassified Nocardiopsis TaxID=2649073 RepID=UPI00135A8FA7|nr:MULTISPECIES: hypothetical protein [unclassified Nocardiopsis]